LPAITEIEDLGKVASAIVAPVLEVEPMQEFIKSSVDPESKDYQQEKKD